MHMDSGSPRLGYSLRFAASLLLALSPLSSFAAEKKLHVWLTTADKANLVKEQSSLTFGGQDQHASPALLVNDEISYQTIDGFGHALTGGTAQLMMKMSPAARTALLKEMFGAAPGQGHMSYIRVSIGASDMNDHVYTYDDMPAGSTDPDLNHFSLDPDKADVIPVLKEILTIQPGIKILASPWTAPVWMKDSGLPKGGTLKKDFYPAYAQYLVKYLQGMQGLGIPIATITVQNEPENPHNTPSMVLTAEQEADFIGTAFGPALEKAGLHTEIVAFDHNCDHPNYPITVLKDPLAGKYTGGAGFHLYAGQITALSVTHDAAPMKDIFFTEQLVLPRRTATDFNVADPMARVLIGATNNWSRNVLLWNLAADPQSGPHTGDGGCPICSGAVTLDGDTVTRNLAYYVTAQITPFVPAGSVRIFSAVLGYSSGGHIPFTLPNVAFRTPDNQFVLLVANTNKAPVTFPIRFKGKDAMATLPAGAVATYVW
jgi:glucosylceramidase